MILRTCVGSLLEFAKLATNGGNSSIIVSTRRFRLDPAVEIEASQWVTDVLWVDVLFTEPNSWAYLIPHLRQNSTDIEWSLIPTGYMLEPSR